MRLLFFLFSALALAGCSDDSGAPPNQVLDMGQDQEKDIAEDVADVAPDIAPEDIVCSKLSDCPRHYSCHEKACVKVLGCVTTSEFEPETGCSFDHGEETFSGYFSAAECESDSDCTNPEEPNCIARICSRFTPCTEDIECSSGEECRFWLYCR